MATNTHTSMDLDDILNSLHSLQLDITSSLENKSPTKTKRIDHQSIEATKVQTEVIVEEEDEFPLPPPPEDLQVLCAEGSHSKHQSNDANNCEVVSTDSGIQNSPPPVSVQKKKKAWTDDTTINVNYQQAQSVIKDAHSPLDKYRASCSAEGNDDQISGPQGFKEEKARESTHATQRQEAANECDNSHQVSTVERKETKEEKKAREKREKLAAKERDKLEKQRKKQQCKKLSSSTSVDESIPDGVKLSITSDEGTASLLSVQLPVGGGNKNNKSNQQQQPQRDFCLSSIQERIKIMNEIFSKSNLRQMAVRIHNLDKTTKMVLVDERMKTGHVCNLMANKNLTERRLNHAIVEKLPDMKMERIIEDHELLADTLLAWPDNSKNLLFFEERDDKYGAITNANVYLSKVYKQEDGETATQQQVRNINDLFECPGAVPNIKEPLYVRQPGSKVWKKKVCTVRGSGIYIVKEKKGSTQDLVCLTSFNDQHMYTTLGGWTKSKIDSPTPYGFALKPLHTQTLHSKQIYFFATPSDSSLRIWSTVIRVAMDNTQYYLNYQQAYKTANRS